MSLIRKSVTIEETKHGPLLLSCTPRSPSKRIVHTPYPKPRPLNNTVQFGGITRRWQYVKPKRQDHVNPKLHKGSSGSSSPKSLQVLHQAISYQLEFQEDFVFVDGIALLEVSTEAHPLFPGIPDSVTPLELVTIVRAYLNVSKGNSTDDSMLSLYEQTTRYPQHSVVLRVKIPNGRSVAPTQFQHTPRVEIITEDEGQSVLLKATLHMTLSADCIRCTEKLEKTEMIMKKACFKAPSTPHQS